MNAQIAITGENGKILKQVNLPAAGQGISGSGKKTLNIDAAMLSPGVYNYSLNH